MNTHYDSRRSFIRQTMAGVLTLGTVKVSMASVAQPTLSESLFTFGGPVAQNEKVFRQTVLPRAALSLAACQLAVDKCTNVKAKEFAGFELTEATAVVKVLKELGTPNPAMDANAKATLQKFKSASTGAEFDKLFMQAEYDNHVFLQELAKNYLQNAAGKTSAAESQTQHLATVALALFQEHVLMTRRILTEIV